jgi:hypothetical protein
MRGGRKEKERKKERREIEKSERKPKVTVFSCTQ